MKSVTFFVLTLFLFVSLSAIAQDEFHAEIGPVIGSSFYIGDAQSKYPENAEMTYGLLLRYRFNERLALKVEGNMTKASGAYFSSSSTFMRKFRNDLWVVDVCGEFNFFDYVYHSYKLTGRRYSPYILAGVGGMAYDSGPSFAINPSVSFGFGVKIKLANRLNMNVQYAGKLLIADDMEGISTLNNAAKLNGTNFLNNDLLSSLTVAVTLDFWRKAQDCKCYYH